MRTFEKTTSRRRARAGFVLCAVRERVRLLRAGNEDGFLLVEVMISAMMVALIVTATFNGLDVATRLSAEQRHRNQAELLASASQEQLRSLPATALDELVGASHSYTRALSGVTYTIKQTAVTVAATAENKTGCTVTETAASTAANFRIVSTVTWKQQEKAKRPAVAQSGVISPPTGSGIEVDVINGSSTGVAGVTARAKFIPNESGTYNTVEGTTSAAGCVVLSGIQATEATVEILQKTGYVTHSGALVPPTKTLTIAPNITTHYVVPYAEAGRLKASFTYKKAPSWEGKEVKSDTFVAAQPEKMETAPEYEVGSSLTATPVGVEEEVEALTGKYEASGSYTARAPKYPNGDLFPFASGWTVFAGDCAANDTSTETLATPAPVVGSGETKLVEVPLTVTKLAIWTGSGPSKKGALYGANLTNPKGSAVKITNTGCESAAAPNNSPGLEFTHGQKETLPGTTKGGMLENPFQPAGKFKLCLVYAAQKKTFSVNYENLMTTISEPAVYLEQKPNAEVTAKVASTKAEVEAKAPYKEKSGYVNKGTEAATLKGKYETEKTAYTTNKGKYETEKTAYTADLGKYNTEKAAYTSNKGKYETEKTAYTTDLGKYNTEKTKATTKATEAATKKKSYEKNKKSTEKTEYEKLEKESKEAETAYKKYEAEYKEDKTEYENYETLYKNNETAYKKYEAEYKEDKTEYEKYEPLYKNAEAAYKKYETEYKAAEQQATEYQYYLEWKAAEVAYKGWATELTDATASGVTAESKEEC